MPIDPEALASSIEGLAMLNAATGLEEALELVIEETNRIFEVDGAGLMLVTEGGVLRYVVASDERGRLLENLQEQVGHGPCVDAFEKSEPVVAVDVATDPRWERLGDLAGRNGIHGVLGVPIGFEDIPIGTLNVYSTEPHNWDDTEIEAIQAFGRIAMSVLRTAAEAHVQGRIADQLQYALEHRIVIEQAKGVLMEREGLDPRGAFELLRNSARANRERVVTLAERVVAGESLQRPASPS